MLKIDGDFKGLLRAGIFIRDHLITIATMYFLFALLIPDDDKGKLLVISILLSVQSSLISTYTKNNSIIARMAIR
jgi:hypothetical protein